MFLLICLKVLSSPYSLHLSIYISIPLLLSLRQSKAKQIEAAQTETRWSNLVCRLRDLEMQLDKMNAQLRHFERTLHASQSKDRQLKSNDKDKQNGKQNSSSTSTWFQYFFGGGS